MKRNLLSSLCITMTCILLNLNMVQAENHDAAPKAVVAKQPSLIVEPPLSGPLAKGLIVMPFHTENLKIVPIYGEAALDVIPRIGHLHITVDNAPWHWVHSSEEPIVIQGLPQGSHRITVKLANPNHEVLAIKELNFSIP